jgi:hypothetical protein
MTIGRIPSIHVSPCSANYVYSKTNTTREPKRVSQTQRVSQTMLAAFCTKFIGSTEILKHALI